MLEQLAGDRREGAHGRAARPALEHTHLAHDLAGAGPAEQDVAARHGLQHLDLAGGDQEDGPAGLPLAEHDLARVEPDLVHAALARRGRSVPPGAGWARCPDQCAFRASGSTRACDPHRGSRWCK